MPSAMLPEDTKEERDPAECNVSELGVRRRHGGMDKEDEVHMIQPEHHSSRKEGSRATCSNMDGPRASYRVKKKEKTINTYMQHLKKWYG